MKAMVLFSGGVDSTTALALAVEKYGASEVLALSIYYGQKHKKELEAAQKVVNYYGVAWKQLDLTTIFADSNCSLLENSTEEIPQESYAEQLEKTNGAPVSTYVPFRNGLFLASAASMAIYEGSGHELRVEAPFVTWTKKDIVKKGLELHVPYELTWSCYEGGKKPCGVCGTCRDRRAAFLANGVEDPLLK